MKEEAILQSLEEIKHDLAYIKSHLAYGDVILTDEDLKALQEAEDDLKKGKTKRL